MKLIGKSKGSQGRLSYSAFGMHSDPGRLSPLPSGPKLRLLIISNAIKFLLNFTLIICKILKSYKHQK